MKTWLNHLGTHLMWPNNMLFLPNFSIWDLFRGVFFGAATQQSSGSNPDRSPAAQWLSTRISLASRLPAGCRPPGVQSRRVAARPGVGGKPARRGRFSEINILTGWLQGSSQNA